MTRELLAHDMSYYIINYTYTREYVCVLHTNTWLVYYILYSTTTVDAKYTILRCQNYVYPKYTENRLSYYYIIVS